MRRVCFALLPETVLLDVAGPAEAFRVANRLVPGSYALEFVAPSRRIRTGVGLTLGELKPLPARLAHGAIIVLSGVVGEVAADTPAMRRLTAWLRAAAATPEATLMCVCAGAVVAAHAGLLRNRRCTTHHACIQELRRADPSCEVYENRIFVADRRVLTSAGITAGVDLALHVIGLELGYHVAAAVAREMVVYMRRSGTDPALSPWVMHRNHLHPAVHRVQDAISREPATAWSATRLARLACTSSRNLTRLFAQHARCSPLDYVQRMRFALARELVTQSALPLEQVAERAGFSSAHQLRRVWRRWEVQPPTALRGGAARGQPPH